MFGFVVEVTELACLKGSEVAVAEPIEGSERPLSDVAEGETVVVEAAESTTGFTPGDPLTAGTAPIAPTAPTAPVAPGIVVMLPAITTVTTGTGTIVVVEVADMVLDEVLVVDEVLVAVWLGIVSITTTCGFIPTRPESCAGTVCAPPTMATMATKITASIVAIRWARTVRPCCNSRRIVTSSEK